MSNLNQLLVYIKGAAAAIQTSEQAYDLSMIVSKKAREAFKGGSMEAYRVLNDVADTIWKHGDYLFDKECKAVKPTRTSRSTQCALQAHNEQAQRFMRECEQREFVLRSMGVI